MKSGSLLSNIGWLGMSGLLSKPVWFLFILYAARVLGTEAFGAYAFLLALAMMVSAFTDLGLDLQITRVVSPSKKDAEVTVSISMAIRLLAGILMLLAGLGLFRFMFRDAYPADIFFPGFLIGVCMFLLTHLRAVFRALEVLRQEALSLMLEKLLIPAATLPALMAGGGLATFLTLYLTAYAVVLLAAVVQLRWAGIRRVRMPTGAGMAGMARDSMPFALLNLVQTIYVRLGTLSLERFTGNLGQIGHLHAGARLQEAFSMIPSIVMGAVFPVFCRVHARGSTMAELADLTARVLLAASVPVGATLYLAAGDVTHLLYGPGFAQGADAVGIFGLTIILSSQVFLFGSIVSASGLQPRLNRLLIAAFLASLAIYLLVNGHLTAEIAAWLAAFDQGLLLLINGWMARRHLRGGAYLGIAGRALAVPLALYAGLMALTAGDPAGQSAFAEFWSQGLTGFNGGDPAERGLGDGVLRILAFGSVTAGGLVLLQVIRWKDVLRMSRINETLRESP